MDASSIIAFYSEINEPSLLHKLVEFGYDIIVPIAVVEEIRKGRKPTLSILNKAIEERKIVVHKRFSVSEISNFGKRYPNLDEGEIQVLILGLKLKREGKENFCVLDEGPATKIAKKKGIAKKGTIGLLDLLSELGIIDKNRKENLLNELKQSTFRIKL